MSSTFDHQDWAEIGETLLTKPRTAAFDRILARLGRVRDVDRAWVIRYNDAFTHFWNVHEWVRPGVPQHVHDLQGIPVSLSHWLNQPLLRGETCAINDLSEMPRSASVLRKEWERQRIRSLLALLACGRAGWCCRWVSIGFMSSVPGQPRISNC